jgi:hypothetical protein
VTAGERRGDSPFDVERRDAEYDAEPIAEDRSPTQAPFDVERESAVARAA